MAESRILCCSGVVDVSEEALVWFRLSSRCQSIAYLSLSLLLHCVFSLELFLFTLVNKSNACLNLIMIVH